MGGEHRETSVRKPICLKPQGLGLAPPLKSLLLILVNLADYGCEKHRALELRVKEEAYEI